MIKNIVFDIGNVLAGFAWEAFFRKFHYSDEVYEKMANATVYTDFWNELDRGVLNEEELLAGFIQNDPSIEQEIRTTFSNVKGMISRFDYAIPWIKELKSKGYGVYFVSNFSEKAHRECIDALDFLPEMDGGILSYQDKVIKPGNLSAVFKQIWCKSRRMCLYR